MKPLLEQILAQGLGAPPGAALLALGGVMARLGLAVWLAPFLGGRAVPATVKTALVLLLGLLMAPQLAAVAPRDPGMVLAALLLLKEAFVGLALGLLGALVFWGAEAAGRLADTARGSNMAEVLLPQSGARSSPLGGLMFQLALVLFLGLGGHRLYLLALGGSYAALPLSQLPSTQGLQGLCLLSMRLSADLLLVALSLAAPVVVVGLLSDLILGVINRFAPQVNVFFLAMPAKAVLGIAVLALAVELLLGALPPLLGGAVQGVQGALEVLGR